MLSNDSLSYPKSDSALGTKEFLECPVSFDSCGGFAFEGHRALGSMFLSTSGSIGCSWFTCCSTGSAGFSK